MKAQKKLNSLSALVYSTDPSVKLEPEEEPQETPEPKNQKLRIWFETKHRGGKAVTIVAGFVGGNTPLEELGKKLKQACGTGGAVKEGE
ncbi:MAG TPA: translation initiation factor, partial [Phnomibacter sp.]|nr:translation initiation factor [Phnomibacter sp.]